MSIEREHPETYTLTRAEWSEINRALAGASLALRFPSLSKWDNDDRHDRRARVDGAQRILSEVYARARK